MCAKGTKDTLSHVSAYIRVNLVASKIKTRYYAFLTNVNLQSGLIKFEHE